MSIYNQFFILFVLIGIGYLSKKTRIISNNMNKDLGNLILYIALPALIIQSTSTFTYSKEMIFEVINVAVIGFCLYLFYIVMSLVFPKILGAKGTQKDIIQFMTIFANTGFMGFPVALVFFGEKGLFYMVIVNIFYDVFAWTYGVTILSRPSRGDEHQKMNLFSLKQLKGLINPCLIAVLLGLLFLILSIQLPTTVTGVLDMLGSIASPLAMLFIGSMLADLQFTKIFANKMIALSSSIRLIVLPLLVYFLLKALSLSGLMLSIPVMATAMPAAATTPLLAEKFGNDSYFSSQIVFVSTLFSALTIPLFVYILKSF